MKREIKFRGIAINPFDGWVYGSLIILTDSVTEEKSFYIVYESGEKISVQPKSVGQYTGLKDKNGVEIYEGDIYKLGAFYYKIVFDNGAYCVTHIKKHSTTPINWMPDGEDDCKIEDFASNIEVIDNIHANPELLP